jgi:ubiquinone/menaquinone biosynthesis C-methylase UbiE
MDPKILNTMRADWNARARENARHYVQNATADWNERDFFRSGEINVANDIMPEMHRICGGGRSPLDLHMLEIGCGVGRMTRMLARIFGRVTAVDVSDEMLAEAKKNLAGFDNVALLLGDGASFSGVPDGECDFAFSFIVFQHIPSIDVIRSYCRDVCRVLKPGSLFKFQVQGSPEAARDAYDTWSGVPITLEQAQRLADDTGFALEAAEGAGTQYFWLRFRKP